MKSFLSLGIMFVVFQVTAISASANESISLWTRKDYKITINSWIVEKTSDGQTKVSVTLAYEIPQNQKFHLYASRSIEDSGLGDSLSGTPFVILDTSGKGKATLVMQDEQPKLFYYLWLWRGVGGNSPSGIAVECTLVDFTPKQISVIRHSEDQKKDLPKK